MSQMTEFLKGGAAELQKELAEEKELKTLTREQRLAQARDAKARQLDVTTPAPTFDPDAERAEYYSELTEIAQEKDPTPEIICPTLSKTVPMGKGHLILVAAHSGKGKSTVVANLCYSLWQQKKKILVISNEEPKKDVYHRVGCIQHSIPLGKVKSDQLSSRELSMLAETADEVFEYVHVIDQSFKGKSEYVKTIDGFKYVWKSIDFSQYAAVVIDYYQNVTSDSRVPSKSPWEVQSELADFLDSEKNVISCPIVVFAQLKLFSDEEKEFEERLKGRKIIFDKCTFAVEIRAKKDKFMSEWWVYKDRWMGRDGVKVFTGFDKANSRFVDYNEAFRMKSDAWVREAQEARSAFDRRDDGSDSEDQG